MEELIQKLRQLYMEKLIQKLNQIDAQRVELITQWTELNRNYPIGFIFPYFCEKAIIKTAFARLDDFGIPKYICYGCFIPSWCDDLEPDDDTLVQIPEFTIDKVLGAKN